VTQVFDFSELKSFTRVCPKCAIEYNFLETNDPPEKCWDCGVELIGEEDMLEVSCVWWPHST
jgi:hypothetical protein